MAIDGDGRQILSAEIGRRIRSYRKRAGISGVSLAASAGISQPFLSQLESGQTSVAIATLYRIAQALGIQPSDLLPAPATSDMEIVRSAATRSGTRQGQSGIDLATAQFGAGKRVSELNDWRVPADEVAADWFSSEGEHILYVLEGTLRLESEGTQEILLEEGDAAFYTGRLPHDSRASGPARIVHILMDA